MEHSQGTQDRMPAAAWLGLTIYSLALGILGCVGIPFKGHDEPRVAGIARAMALTGDFVVPRLNGRPFLEYPSLGYVLPALVLARAGEPNEFLTHAAFALFGTGTVLTMALAGTRARGWRFGLAAGILTQTTAAFFGVVWNCTVDVVLMFFVAVACVGFHIGWRDGSRLGAASFWLGMAAGFLTKGLVGIAVPLSAAAVYLGGLQAARWMRWTDVKVWRNVGWLWGPLLLAAPVGTWFALVYRSGGDELAGEVIRQSFVRFTSRSADHAQPAWFYLPIVLYSTLPLPILALVAAARRWILKRRGASMPLQLEGNCDFYLVWFVTTLLGLSVASAKRNLYLAPLYPAAGMLSAHLWTYVAPSVSFTNVLRALWITIPLGFAAGRSATILHFGGRDVSYSEVFDALPIVAPDRPIVLYRPTEGLEGAAVFYTGKEVPVAHTPEKLATALAMEPGAWVLLEERHAWVPSQPVIGELTVEAIREFEVGKRRVVVAEVKP